MVKLRNIKNGKIDWNLTIDISNTQFKEWSDKYSIYVKSFNKLITKTNKSNWPLKSMIALINIRSIYSNIELLIDYIIEFKLVLVALTETWLSAIDNGNVINTQLLPLRYKFIHIIRKNGCRLYTVEEVV